MVGKQKGRTGGKRGRATQTVRQIDRLLNTYRYGGNTKSGVNVFGFWFGPEGEDVRREGWSESKRDEREVWRQVWV